MNEIIKSISIENFVAQNDRVIELMHKAIDLARQASEIAASIGLEAPELTLRPSYASRESYINGKLARDREAYETVTKAINRGAWRHLMDESGMKTFMDQKSRQEWSSQLNDGEVPAVTVENIQTTFSTLNDNRGEMFIDGVVNIFRGLSWDHKTNSPIKFGKKVIMKCFVDRFGGISYNSRDKIDDLMRVICLLAGKPEPDHRDSLGRSITSLVRMNDTNSFENDYLIIKWFKVGTGHIVFKKAEIVNELNQILAKRFPNALAGDMN